MLQAMYRPFFIILLSCFCLRSHAQQHISKAAFINIDPKLGKVVYHHVDSHETLYSIARGYGVREASIVKINPKMQLRQNRRDLPKVIIIPIHDNQIMSRLPLFKRKQDFVPVYYKAKKKDNLFRISRVYFDMPTDLLASRNRIRNKSIKNGQVLHVGWLKKTFEPLVVHVGKPMEEDSEMSNLPETAIPLAEQFKADMGDQLPDNRNEVAYWKADEKNRGLFVMHRRAKQRSVIEITNPMYGTIIYAKVLGNIPQHLYPEEVDLVVSQEVAQALKAKDSKFFVRTRYR